MTAVTSKEHKLTVFCSRLDEFIASGKDPMDHGPLIQILDEKQRIRKKGQPARIRRTRKTDTLANVIETGVIHGPLTERILNKEERRFIEETRDSFMVSLGLIDPRELDPSHPSYCDPYSPVIEHRGPPPEHPAVPVPHPKRKPIPLKDRTKFKLIFHTDNGVTEHTVTIGEMLLIETKQLD